MEVYYSKDPTYEGFFEEGVTWDPTRDHLDQQEETTGLKRSAAKKGRHLRNLLTMLSSHLPWPHIMDKIITETRSLADVWTVIETAYGVTPTHDMFLDLMSFSKIPTESNLTFYERPRQDPPGSRRQD